MPKKDTAALQALKGELKTKLAALTKEKGSKREDFREAKKRLRRVTRRLKVIDLAANKGKKKAEGETPAAPAAGTGEKPAEQKPAEQPAGQT